MSEEQDKPWKRPRAPKRRKASGYAMGTPEQPVGVPVPAQPGASTQARCKTCRPLA